MQSCPLCRAGGRTIHENALLLHEALRVAAMHKSEREAYYVRARNQGGEEAARDLVAVVNTIRRREKGTE